MEQELKRAEEGVRCAREETAEVGGSLLAELAQSFPEALTPGGLRRSCAGSSKGRCRRTPDPVP